MKKAIMALLALSLVFVEPMEAASQLNSKAGYIRQEYRKFVDAFKCMRRSGFKKCSSSQKKRIVIAGLAVVTCVVITSGGAYLCLRKKQTNKYAFLFQSQNDEPLSHSSHCTEEKPTLTVDLDDVMSGNVVAVSDYVRLVGKVSLRHPCKIIRLIPQLKHLKKQGEHLSKSGRGASDIIEEMLVDRELLDYKDAVIDRGVNPKPIEDMVKAIASLKQSGYRIIGATNQDYRIFKTYKEKMNKLGIPMEELFDWVLTTRADSVNVGEAKKYVDMDDNIYMLVDPKAAKPNPLYYETLKEIEWNVFNKSPEKFVHIDDRKENTDGAKKVNQFDGIHFALPRKKVSRSTKSEISATVRNLKDSLKEKGITFQ